MTAPAVPKEVLDAFAPPPVAVAGRRLEPLSALHYLALARFAPGIVGEGAFTGTEAVMGLLILTTPAGELRALMGRPAAEVEAAAYDLAASVPLADLLAWPAALAAHLDRAFAPALAARTETEKKRSRMVARPRRVDLRRIRVAPRRRLERADRAPAGADGGGDGAEGRRVQRAGLSGESAALRGG